MSGSMENVAKSSEESKEASKLSSHKESKTAQKKARPSAESGSKTSPAGGDSAVGDARGSKKEKAGKKSKSWSKSKRAKATPQPEAHKHQSKSARSQRTQKDTSDTADVKGPVFDDGIQLKVAKNKGGSPEHGPGVKSIKTAPGQPNPRASVSHQLPTAITAQQSELGNVPKLEWLVQLLDRAYTEVGIKSPPIDYTTRELYMLLDEALESFSKQSCLVDVCAPIYIVGDIHGQFNDLIKIFITLGIPPNVRYLFLKVFDQMPVFGCVNNKILGMHGGFSPCMTSLDQLRGVPKPIRNPTQGLINDALWADPDFTIKGWQPSLRGTSFNFGPDTVETLCERMGLDLVVRAHQVCHDGYWFFADKRMVTVFSAPNYCGNMANAGAVMEVRWRWKPDPE